MIAYFVALPACHRPDEGTDTGPIAHGCTTTRSPASDKTTEMMVILTAKAGVTRQQIMTIVPAEIRATVKLYLDGKIRQWYSRGDGKGVVLSLDARTVEEAHAIMETLPLSKENLMEHEYTPVGPLMPLAGLLGGGPTRE